MPTETVVGRSEATVVRIATQIAAILATTGAIATLFYAGGLLNQITYLSAFRAPWLSGEITTGEIFRGGLEILPAVVIIPIAVAASRRASANDWKTMWFAAAVLMLGALFVLTLDVAFARYFLLATRSYLDVAGAIFCALAAGYVSAFAVLRAMATAEATAFRNVASGLIVIALLFAAVPTFAGRARAFYHLAKPSRLPCAQTAAGVNLPIVAVTKDRIFCLASYAEGAPPKLLVVKWEAVVSVTPATAP